MRPLQGRLLGGWPAHPGRCPGLSNPAPTGRNPAVPDRLSADTPWISLERPPGPDTLSRRAHSVPASPVDVTEPPAMARKKAKTNKTDVVKERIESARRHGEAAL